MVHLDATVDGTHVTIPIFIAEGREYTLADSGGPGYPLYTAAIRRSLCSAGNTVVDKTYPKSATNGKTDAHMAVVSDSAADTLLWPRQRFAGAAAPIAGRASC